MMYNVAVLNIPQHIIKKARRQQTETVDILQQIVIQRYLEGMI